MSSLELSPPAYTSINIEMRGTKEGQGELTLLLSSVAFSLVTAGVGFGGMYTSQIKPLELLFLTFILSSALNFLSLLIFFSQEISNWCRSSSAEEGRERERQKVVGGKFWATCVLDLILVLIMIRAFTTKSLSKSTDKIWTWFSFSSTDTASTMLTKEIVTSVIIALLLLQGCAALIESILDVVSPPSYLSLPVVNDPYSDEGLGLGEKDRYSDEEEGEGEVVWGEEGRVRLGERRNALVPV